MCAPDLSLIQLGWDASWKAARENTHCRGMPGRVIRDGRICAVQTEAGPVHAQLGSARASAGDRDEHRPVCGDWVVVGLHPGNDGRGCCGTIRALLPRRSAITRRAVGARHRPQAIVANVDAVWIVCGLDRSQGIRSLERYQALVRGGEVPVRILLNKADACVDVSAELERARQVAPGLEVAAVSATQGWGLERVLEHLVHAGTIALVGPSGVGKTTLVNVLGCAASGRTAEVRAADHRGRHTTSSRYLAATRAGALLVDTPGLRELGLWKAGDGLEATFADVREAALGCRFRNCRHDGEPGCAVRAALEANHLSADRFMRYLELRAEVAHSAAHRPRRRGRAARRD